MKPTTFKHQNIVFAKDQPEYQPLPALKLDTPEGEVISCWKMNWKERIKVVITGRVWLSLLSFNKPLTPSIISVNRRDIYSHPDDTKLSRKINSFLPIYLPRYNSKYQLAIWNCGIQPSGLWQTLKDIRITIRVNGRPILIIKKGSV